MSDILIFWLVCGGILLLIELLTTTFYALSLSLACLLVGLYIWITGDVEVTVLQAILFLVFSITFGYIFPKIFTEKNPESQSKVGLDRYVGSEFIMERSGKHWRVLLDGVSYIVSPKYHKPEIGDIVIVTAIKSGEILVDKAPGTKE